MRKHRLVPSAVVFVVVAVGVYLTAFMAISLLQHIVMPIIAVLIAGFLATVVYKHTWRAQ